MAAAAVADGVDIVVAMGGDGMVHHVAQAVVGSSAALGIVPVGTTNVIARLLGVPSRPIKAAKLIAAGPSPRKIGVLSLRAERGSVETVHHAIFACGLGLDAEVVVRADEDPYRKYRFGSVHYARTAVSVAMGSFASRKPHVAVSIGELEDTVTTVLVQFRDVYTYFGKVPLRLSDDPPRPMTVLTLGRMKRRRIPRIGVTALLGRDLDRIEGMEVVEGVDRLAFTADPSVPVQADGESLGLVDAGEMTWVDDALQVLAGPQPPG